MDNEQATLPIANTGGSSDPEINAMQGYKLGDDFAQLQYASIMIVDDEPLTMDVVQTFLEDAGYRKFILVEDSVKAMDQLREHRPDALLLDVMMPVVSGFDILSQLRADPDFTHLPVIILTSSTDAETKLTALDLGATDFLSKPVDPSELALRIRNTLAAKAYQDQLAYYDLITNLPNGQLFQDRTDWAIDRARREHSKMAMLHITFDDFKRITDTFGPTVGDDVLRQLAERLTANVRVSDAMSRDTINRSKWFDIFRVGGAEFSVLLPFVEDVGSAALVGKRVLEAMRKPLIADGTEVYLTPSIGVAGFPEDAADTTTLIKCALGASSQAVEQGYGRLKFYSAEMNETSLRRFRFEAGLRSAVDNGEFRLLYQPKVSVETGAIIGAEALIRWQKPDGEIVAPAEFIPVAEENGLILPVGEWALREACRQIARWRSGGFDMKVSVNISARQFFETDLAALVQSVASEYEIDSTQLVLEITETVLMDNVEQAIATIEKLRDLGLQISVDDFGTGYSSLSYLKRFPIDEVKIDRTFLIDAVTSRKDQALVSAVTYLAHQFGFRACAEGVEDEAQLDFLKRIRCDEYQGYYFSRPISANDFADKLQQEVELAS